MLKASFVVLTLVTMFFATPTAPPRQIQGLIQELNTPGTIAVQITAGTADGVETGDELLVQRNGKTIGRLEVIELRENSSIANILAAERPFERGDVVIVPADTIHGVLMQHNAAGLIAVQISVGEADGVEIGDIFVVKRNSKWIGKLKVSQLREQTAVASIISAPEPFERGDLVVMSRGKRMN